MSSWFGLPEDSGVSDSPQLRKGWVSSPLWSLPAKWCPSQRGGNKGYVGTRDAWASQKLDSDGCSVTSDGRVWRRLVFFFKLQLLKQGQIVANVSRMSSDLDGALGRVTLKVPFSVCPLRPSSLGSLVKRSRVNKCFTLSPVWPKHFHNVRTIWQKTVTTHLANCEKESKNKKYYMNCS